MEQLIEDYKRKLATVNEMLENKKSNGSISDNEKFIRLKTKAANYRTFIAELEKESKYHSTIKSFIESHPNYTTLLEQYDLTDIFKDIDLQLMGYNVHRLNPENGCPEQEVEFIKFLNKWFKGNPNILNQAIFGANSQGRPKDYLNDREERIVASLIQWLGSPVGFTFLSDVYNVHIKRQL